MPTGSFPAEEFMLKSCGGNDESFTPPRRHRGSYHHTPQKNTDDDFGDGAGSRDASTDTLREDASGFYHTVRTCPRETAHEAKEAVSALESMCEQLQDQLRDAEISKRRQEQEHALAIRETEGRMNKHIMLLEDALDAERAESSRLRQAPLERKHSANSRTALVGETRVPPSRRASADGGLGSSKGWRSQEKHLLDNRIRSQESSLRSLRSDVAILRRRLRMQADMIEKQKEENETLRRTAEKVARIEDNEITMLASDLDAAILEAKKEGQRRCYLEERLLITEKRLLKWRTAAIGVDELDGASDDDEEESHGRTLPLSRSSIDGDGEMRHENLGASEISEIQSRRGDDKDCVRVRGERTEVNHERDVELMPRSSRVAMSAIATDPRRPEVVPRARAQKSPDRQEDKGTDGNQSWGGSSTARPFRGRDSGSSSSGRAESKRAGRRSSGATNSTANGVFKGAISRRDRTREKTTPERRGSARWETSERSYRSSEVGPSPDRRDVLAEDTRATRHSSPQEATRLDDTEVEIFRAGPLAESAGSTWTTLLGDEPGDDASTPRLGNDRKGCQAVTVSAAHVSAARRGAQWSAAIAEELRSAVIPAYSSSPVSPSSVADFPEENVRESEFSRTKIDAERSPYVPGTFREADSPLGAGGTRVAVAELLGRLALCGRVPGDR